MLPYIILGWTKVSMFGLGIAISLFVFLYSAYTYCKKNQLDFKQFFFALPWCFAIIYVFGKFAWYYLESKQLIHWGGEIFSYVISPNGSDFHYTGIVAGAVVSLLIFFSNKTKSNIKNIMDMIFVSTMRMCVVLGIFLTLSDNVIGIPNDHWRMAIRALVPYSKIQSFGQVYPYGFIISIIALASYIITKLLDIKLSRTWIGYLGFAVFFALMMYWFSYELYAKHGVMRVAGFSLDVKHYINIILIIICLIEYYRISKDKK
jgi:hypothetical protein